MNLQQESNTLHSIQAYDTHGVYINQQYYQASLLLTKTELIMHAHLCTLESITPHICTCLKHKPMLFIIGHPAQTFIPPEQYAAFIQHHIGLECMSIAAACRTFNILLHEDRNAALFLMLSALPKKRFEKLRLIET